MNIKKFHLLNYIAVILAFLYIPSAIAKDGWRVSMGAGFFSGDYTSTQKTEISLLSLSTRFKSGRWTLKASVPYLQISGPNATVGIDGLSTSGSNTNKTTNKGMGDLLLDAKYLLHYSKDPGWGISAGTKVKLPTASTGKKLGTGQMDKSFYVSPFYQTGKLTYFATLGYKFYGNSRISSYNDVWYTSFGAMYSINPSFKAGLSLSLREKVTTNSEPKRQITPFISYEIDKKNKLQFYVLKGYSKASPDWGTGLTFSHQY